MSNANLVGKTIFGEYTITRKLGEGGMGSVYLASQQAIDQHIAIKVLHASAAKSDELVKRFNREAKTITMLTHPNIIRVFIFGRTEDGLIYLAMEFVRGRSLRQELARGAMDEMRAIKILKQTLSALGEAHEIGIIHRDLKPDNILLTTYRGQTDFVKVLDFGIAKVKETDGVPEQQLTQAGVVYGTPEYLSPEQAQALELDQRTDLYSLGVILYEMMTGVVPFKANTAVQILMNHVHTEPRPPSQHRPVDPQMEKIILKALAKDPNKRYRDAAEFLEALLERERELIRTGHSIDQIRMPGQDATQAMILPDDISTLAKQVSQGGAAAPRPPSGVETVMSQPVPSGGISKTVLIFLIVLLLLMLAVIGGLIVVFATKG